jgi:putative transposon-encoded protein
MSLMRHLLSALLEVDGMWRRLDVVQFVAYFMREENDELKGNVELRFKRTVCRNGAAADAFGTSASGAGG